MNVDVGTILSRLEAMPGFLAERLASLSAAEASVRGSGDTFSPVEQCWHLADLEAEGFGLRIRRILDEENPSLPDFDGARIAEERDYRRRNLVEGVAVFQRARAANLAVLRSVTTEQWSRGGTQEGIGPVTLGDLPRLMAEHDAGHRAEIEEWERSRKT